MRIMTIFIITVVALLTFTISHQIMSTQEKTVDEQTKELCREYADLDHEKELAPERWQWFLDQGIDPNTHFDWY